MYLYIDCLPTNSSEDPEILTLIYGKDTAEKAFARIAEHKNNFRVLDIAPDIFAVSRNNNSVIALHNFSSNEINVDISRIISGRKKVTDLLSDREFTLDTLTLAPWGFLWLSA